MNAINGLATILCALAASLLIDKGQPRAAFVFACLALLNCWWAWQ
jgi:hypothetical protein